MTEQIKEEARGAMFELLETAKLRPGDLVVVGCSSSEIVGKKIGTCSSKAAAETVFDSLIAVLKERGLLLAAQCCEHLNRCLVVERRAVEKYSLTEVNVVPHPHAGGAFATTAYERFEDPVVVEHVRASAGMDIGGTLIGMHLLEVAVPVRVSVKQIGEAPITLARTRPKFVGGERAHYNEELL